MKHTDDGTLSLFGDEPLPTPKPAVTAEPLPPSQATTEKKPRARRKAASQPASEASPPPANETAIEPTPPPEVELLAQVTETRHVEPAADIELTPTVEAAPAELTQQIHLVIQRRRNSPWAAATQARPEVPSQPKPHVMVVITKGEAGGAQSHVLALCEALREQIDFTVVIGGPPEDSVLDSN